MNALGHPLPAGTTAPEFSLHSTPDQLVSLSDFRGQPVDAVQDSAQIMFGLAVKESDLHVHDEQRVHWHS